MTDLRKAAEMALEFVDWLCGDDHSVKPKNKALDVREALRQALAQPPCQTGAQCIGGKCPECEREWVALTEEEISEYAWMGQDVVSVIKEVDATLKEKNA